MSYSTSKLKSFTWKKVCVLVLNRLSFFYKLSCLDQALMKGMCLARMVLIRHWFVGRLRIGEYVETG